MHAAPLSQLPTMSTSRSEGHHGTVWPGRRGALASRLLDTAPQPAAAPQRPQVSPGSQEDRGPASSLLYPQAVPALAVTTAAKALRRSPPPRPRMASDSRNGLHGPRSRCRPGRGCRRGLSQLTPAAHRSSAPGSLPNPGATHTRLTGIGLTAAGASAPCGSRALALPVSVG